MYRGFLAYGVRWDRSSRLSKLSAALRCWPVRIY